MFYTKSFKVKRTPLFNIVNKKMFTLEVEEYDSFYKLNKFSKTSQKIKQYRQRKFENIIGNIAGCL